MKKIQIFFWHARPERLKPKKLCRQAPLHQRDAANFWPWFRAVQLVKLVTPDQRSEHQTKVQLCKRLVTQADLKRVSIVFLYFSYVFHEFIAHL